VSKRSLLGTKVCRLRLRARLTSPYNRDSKLSLSCCTGHRLTSKHKGQMTSRQQAASRHLNLDFSDQSQSRGTSSRSTAPAQGGRGFTLQSREVVQQQQLAEHAPMGGAQAAQARRQAQTDRQEESNRRRKAFNTNLTETQREPEPEVRGGFSGPREDVDEATAL
jgi:hypothetical protein